MSLSDPFKEGYEVTPANSNFRFGVGDGIYVVSDGDLEIKTQGGNTLGPFAVVAGQIIPFRVIQVMTGTTAEVIVGTH